MAHDASALNPQLVQQLDHPLGMRSHVDAARFGTVAAPVAEEIHHHESVACGHEGDDFPPQMPGRGKAVHEDDWNAGTTRSGGVVIEPRAGEIEKFAAHEWVEHNEGRHPADDGPRFFSPEPRGASFEMSLFSSQIRARKSECRSQRPREVLATAAATTLRHVGDDLVERRL